MLMKRVYTVYKLTMLITKSGAEYVYLLEAGKGLPKWIAPIPAFLFSWVSVFVLKPSIFAVVSLSFGVYVIEPFYPHCEAPDGLIKLVAILCICKFIIFGFFFFSLFLFQKLRN